MRSQGIEMKNCNSCKKDKPSEEFHKDKRSGSGLQGVCKQCKKVVSHKYRSDNKERLNAEYRETYQKTKEKEAARKKEYYKNNKEKVSARCKSWNKSNPERCAAHSAKHRADNPAKVNAINAKRRATKLQATPAWSDQDAIKDIYIEANYQQMEVDHIIPLRSPRVCGLHTEYNLQLLTKEVNSAKGNRYWPDMPEKQ